MSNIHRTHLATAAVGVAIIVGAASLPFTINPSRVLAAPAQVEGAVDSGGSFASIVEADKPAVVTIVTTMKGTDVSATDDGSPMDKKFKKFLEQQGMPGAQQKPERGPVAQALGSGFIVDPSGIIVTNNHVIDNAADIRVTLDDGTELPATLVGADPKSDLAVLKVQAPKLLPTLAWGDSSALKLGDQILAIGNPFGVGTTVTAGIVSARGRDLHSGPYDDFIQIDAPINHGNSGGPLVDRDGKVVGINTAIYSPNGGSVGVGFAIPSDEAKAIIAKLEKSGSIDHGYLGVQLQPVTPEIADAIGLAKPEGALITSVTDGTPADKAGIKSGDVVTRVGGNDVNTPKDLSRLVADLVPGDKEVVTVWRGGKTAELNVTIGGSDEQDKQAAAENSDRHHQVGPALGIGLADLTPEIRDELKLAQNVDGAVVASIDPDKPAAAAGIQAGDIITKVNDREVHDARDAKTAVADAAKSGRKTVLLLIERAGQTTFVAVPFATS
ncbi:DegQ family serine endoprotease [Rhizobium sp. Root1220]|uniref:DegQ family serine endoprotease n=1 Tax=Rhizobium sp. Root1220 TaxID=1736432 RepID=UPI0006F965C2|nr:DegQ family serine endoprotease [Rhizobium sp. Root1220]KQV70475.1 serine protease [Rhizobium sp. Root1220]